MLPANLLSPTNPGSRHKINPVRFPHKILSFKVKPRHTKSRPQFKTTDHRQSLDFMKRALPVFTRSVTERVLPVGLKESLESFPWRKTAPYRPSCRMTQKTIRRGWGKQFSTTVSKLFAGRRQAQEYIQVS